MADYEVRHSSKTTKGEGTNPVPGLNRRAELVSQDSISALVEAGYGWVVSNPARETAVAGYAGAFSDTAAGFLVIDVPKDYAIIPFEFVLNQGGTVANAAWTLIITADNKVRFSSGGRALTVGAGIDNLRLDAPRAPAVTAYDSNSALTLAANSKDITLWSQIMNADVTPAVDTYNVGVFTYSPRIPPIIGSDDSATSLVIYAYVATTAPSLLYSIKYLEVPFSWVN